MFHNSVTVSFDFDRNILHLYDQGRYRKNQCIVILKDVLSQVGITIDDVINVTESEASFQFKFVNLETLIAAKMCF